MKRRARQIQKLQRLENDFEKSLKEGGNITAERVKRELEANEGGNISEDEMDELLKEGI